jgi:hypothetical protein
MNGHESASIRHAGESGFGMAKEQNYEKRTTMNEKQVQKNDNQKALTVRAPQDIVEVMREEDAAAEREKILQKMNPACRKKLEEIESLLRKEVDHMLRSHYELGLQVKELYDDAKKNNGKVYGKNAIGGICKLLNWDDGLIRAALRFVNTYSQEDLERLCSARLPKGQPLTWSHVRALVPLDKAAERQELLDRTVAEGWTCNQLALEIKRMGDGPAGDGRGRPPRLPKDFDGAVAQQQESAERWDRLYDRVWAKEDRSLVTQAAKLSEDEVTEERLHQARELAWQLRRVAEQAAKQAEKAEEVVQEFERILDERQKADAPAPPAATPRRKTA